MVWERRERPLLQVALDFVDLRDAVKVAVKAMKADILEVGTPLIKSAGMEAVKVISALGRPTLADTKTCDTGALEATMAFNAGAQAMTVMAFSDDSVIQEAVEVAEKEGKVVVADLMHVKDPLQRAKELKELGVKAVELHVGISQQVKYGITAAQLADLAAKIREMGLVVAVAGGLRPETVKDFIGKADIVVVGGYITKSEDPEKAVEEVLKALGRL
ncbi:D-arabino 3-hexulose 6-phosphate aldehyde lyase [Ignicoccus pacificus DSM 13166]|uniref:D-arabino 3-hexulose 6-phosphate aldehyde lyase n=1 Tax=Ignicoccus pacificus DSM 13166 TaxID=940294 RepID=A0A977KAS4_9CREN|nr:D-arabino 3-hexulose 6-phosphate aldehyde lyase [Ignicoccus pacificus DSM 13166]